MKIALKPSTDPKLWHTWYAWHPVRIENVLYWLEPVERRFLSYSFDGDKVFEYRVVRQQEAH